MEIIQRRKTERGERFYLDYRWRNDPEAGFSFECDKDGNVDLESKPDIARENYEKCLSGEHDVVFRGIEHDEWSYRVPAVGKCNDCGCEVELAQFTNTCDCGADYNMSGQQLAPREQWGYETGEHWTDCI